MICWTDQAAFTQIVEKAVKTFKANQRKKVGKIDCLVAQGMSGVTMAAAISAATGIPFVIVRAPDDKHAGTHDFVGEDGSTYKRSAIVNPHLLGENNCFIDDHISGGKTYTRCAESLLGLGAKLEFCFSYNPSEAYHTAVNSILKSCDHPVLKRKAEYAERYASSGG